MTNATQANVTVRELQRAYNRGRRTGEVGFLLSTAPMYRGRPISRMEFGRFGVVSYFSIGDTLIGKFQDQAVIDD